MKREGSFVQSIEGEATRAATAPPTDRRRFLKGGLTTVATGSLVYLVPRVAAASGAGVLSPGELPLEIEVTFADVTSGLTGDFSDTYQSSGSFKLFFDAQQNVTLSALTVQGAPVSSPGFGAFAVQQTSPVAATCAPDGPSLVITAAPPVTAAIILAGCTISTTVDAKATSTLTTSGLTVTVTGTIKVSATCSVGSITKSGSFSIPFSKTVKL